MRLSRENPEPDDYEWVEIEITDDHIWDRIDALVEGEDG